MDGVINEIYAAVLAPRHINKTSNMKLAIILLFLCLNPSVSYCQDTLSNQELLKMFKQINKSDQSQRGDPVARQKIFLNNFKEIKKLIEYQGFVNIDSSFSKKRHKKIIKSGIRRTFTHILQTDPSLILNENFIELIHKELQAKRFCKDCLIVPLSIYVYDNEIKSPFEGVLKNALTAWGIRESEVVQSP